MKYWLISYILGMVFFTISGFVLWMIVERSNNEWYWFALLGLDVGIAFYNTILAAKE